MMKPQFIFYKSLPEIGSTEAKPIKGKFINRMAPLSCLQKLSILENFSKDKEKINWIAKLEKGTEKFLNLCKILGNFII